MREDRAIFKNIDKTLVGLYIVLVLLGWMNIYAAVYNEEHTSIFDFSQSYGKQMVWIISALLIAASIIIIDVKFYSAFSYIIYGFVILLLFSVLIIGTATSGAKSWFEIGSVKIQPSEFAKFATNLALANYLSNYNIRFDDFKTKVVSIMLICIPMLMILLQNDTGSALVFFSFVLVLYREGMTEYVLIGALVIGILFLMALLMNIYILMGIIVLIAAFIYLNSRVAKRKVISLIIGSVLAIGFTTSVDYIFENVLEPHQKDRINVLLGKEFDPRGTGYNVNQAKIAIGSGGFFGKGYLQGTQTKFDFVPEQSTDFIFCTIGEEWGFLGSLVVIALFVWLFLHIIAVAERQRSQFSRIYAYGVASILFFHFMVNVGMAIGLLPVIGIPLPFFSYGGSSLWSFTILLFILVKLDSHRLMIV